jgi:DNA polymerase III alpha subunit
VTLIGWWVTGKTVQDKNGRPMEFVTFEDTSAIYDATFFPKAYEKFCRGKTPVVKKSTTPEKLEKIVDFLTTSPCPFLSLFLTSKIDP